MSCCVDDVICMSMSWMRRVSVWICMFMNIYALWVVDDVISMTATRWQRTVYEYVCIWIFIYYELLCCWCDQYEYELDEKGECLNMYVYEYSYTVSFYVDDVIVRVRAGWQRTVFEYVSVWIFIHCEFLCWWCDSTSMSWMRKDSVWICICINIYILWVVNSDDVISMSTSWMRKDNVYCLVVARTEPFTQPVMATRRSALLSRKSLRKMPSMCFRYIIKRLTLL